MIAVDTNVLVYAFRDEFEFHAPARSALRGLAEGPAAWALPVFVLAEFLRVATHLRILQPPPEEREAIAFLDRLIASPTVRILLPGDRYWPLLRAAVDDDRARGNEVHDAAIAAVCREWGVSEILTHDRDFARFSGLRVQRLS